jgi:hypothetical protein
MFRYCHDGRQKPPAGTPALRAASGTFGNTAHVFKRAIGRDSKWRDTTTDVLMADTSSESKMPRPISCVTRGRICPRVSGTTLHEQALTLVCYVLRASYLDTRLLGRRVRTKERARLACAARASSPAGLAGCDGRKRTGLKTGYHIGKEKNGSEDPPLQALRVTLVPSLVSAGGCGSGYNRGVRQRWRFATGIFAF